MLDYGNRMIDDDDGSHPFSPNCTGFFDEEEEEIPNFDEIFEREFWSKFELVLHNSVECCDRCCIEGTSIYCDVALCHGGYLIEKK